MAEYREESRGPIYVHWAKIPWSVTGLIKVLEGKENDWSLAMHLPSPKPRILGDEFLYEDKDFFLFRHLKDLLSILFMILNQIVFCRVSGQFSDKS